jgi:hypothetical protein
MLQQVPLNPEDLDIGCISQLLGLMMIQRLTMWVTHVFADIEGLLVEAMTDTCLHACPVLQHTSLRIQLEVVAWLYAVTRQSSVGCMWLVGLAVAALAVSAAAEVVAVCSECRTGCLVSIPPYIV